ncbi:hypothetical protein [Pseudochrobactrum sp. HB0163]|uniref:hypothetical protein n=1 Tax=Pseudochrobactrum sp. HB0163 TaxID=3450708 RepID=UPI003F6DCD6E
MLLKQVIAKYATGRNEKKRLAEAGYDRENREIYFLKDVPVNKNASAQPAMNTDFLTGDKGKY